MNVRKGVQKIYTEVAETYELVNHILTFGMDIFWRRKTAKLAAELGGALWLDVCSGTGEMAYNLASFSNENVLIFAADFSYPMLAKAFMRRKTCNLIPVMAEAGSLPFADETFDLITISFATRNLNPRQDVLENYLKEFWRVLRPGGYFVNLETSQPSRKSIKWLYHLYVKWIVKSVGFLISGSKAGYRYLSFTIPRFYSPDEFSRILYRCGFSQVEFQPLFLRVSAIHIAKK
jgi:demethylmenaquinone methyltransferase/2-methoxy-6-polyprenyl-1,4-benzoquinol methylase